MPLYSRANEVGMSLVERIDRFLDDAVCYYDVPASDSRVPVPMDLPSRRVFEDLEAFQEMAKSVLSEDP